MMNATTIYRMLAAVLLAGIGLQRYASFHKSAGVDQYQEHIRTTAAAVPSRIGSWVGEDVHVPAQALTVLKPNVMLSRHYVNVENGHTAGLLLVHCGDAHHMVGHFPLRCYPANGWELRGSCSRDWAVGGLLIAGTEYEFHKELPGPGGGEQSIVVANCLLRPGNKILRDMDSLSKTIIGAGGSSSGAGQIQIYFDSAVPQAQRDAAIMSLIQGYRPVIEAILAEPAD